MGGTHHGLLTTTMNDVVICHLVATLPSVTWHLDSVSDKWMGGRRAVSPRLVVACVCL